MSAARHDGVREASEAQPLLGTKRAPPRRVPELALVVVLLVLRGAPWLNGTVFFVALVDVTTQQLDCSRRSRFVVGTNGSKIWPVEKSFLNDISISSLFQDVDIGSVIMERKRLDFEEQ